MRSAFALAALLLVAGCGGDNRDRAAAARAGGVSLAISGVPGEETEVTAAERPPGPTRGWATQGGVEFFVDTPKQTVDHPATLTFTIDADLFDDATRGQVDQLGVFMPGGIVLGPVGGSNCERNDGSAEPDPCIASREFLDNGDARIVVRASNPATE